MGELQARTALKLLAGSEVPVRSAIADLLEHSRSSVAEARRQTGATPLAG